MGSPNSPPPPPSMPNDPADSSSNSDSGAGAGAGAGALGLAGAGALAGSGALSGSGAFSGSDSANCNDNGNSNENLNMNETTTSVSDCVDVKVNVDACLDAGPPVPYQSDDVGSFNSTTTSTTYNVNATLTDSPINLADANNFIAGGGDSFNFSGSGTDSVFHIDQVNSLIANNQLQNVSLTNNAGFSQSTGDTEGGMSHAGGIDHSTGDTVSAAVSAAANATATLSAFTQNIVLGSNIQYNSLTQSVVGSDVTHTTTASTLDPGMHDHGPMPAHT